MSDDIRAMFAAKRTKAPVRGERDAISLFKGAVKTQITRAEEAKAGKTAKTPALNWFKKRDGKYLLQIGKKPLAIGKDSYWEADDLDDVIRMLEGASALADSDAEFQAVIRKAALDNKTRTTTTTTPAAEPQEKSTRGRRGKA
jgi:hypothetical protein